MQEAICKVCLEPIYYFICHNCLHKEIKKWLKSNAPFLIPELERAHRNLLRTFAPSLENKSTCVVCGKTVTKHFCHYCYTKDIYTHLKKFHAPTAEKMLKFFNFDFENTGYE